MTPFRRRSSRDIITILFLLILQLSSTPAIASGNDTGESANCDIQKGACVQNIGDGTVTLDILPRPVTAMTDLTFNVTLASLQPESDPVIDLDMPGMKMGPNQVPLKKVSNSAYSGKGVIVRCPSGRTLWKAGVTIPGIGTADYTFHVVY